MFCQRHQNYARFSQSGKNYAKLVTLAPDMLEVEARALSTRETIEFPRKDSAKIFTHWIGIQRSSKKRKHLWFSPDPIQIQSNAHLCCVV